MLFYKIEGTLENWSRVDRKEARERAETLIAPTAEFFMQSENRCHIAVCGATYPTKKGTLCAAVREGQLYLETVGQFLSAVDFRMSEYDIKEITLCSYFDLLRLSEKSGFIDEAGDIIKTFGLEDFYDRYDSFFAETVLREYCTKKDLKKKATKLLSGNTLLPEIERIYMGKAVPNVVGHPVHYFIQNDDEKASFTMTEVLLNSLYQNDRLLSRRFSGFRADKIRRTVSEKKVKSLYEASRGGAVVIYFRGDDVEENNYAHLGIGTIITLCKIMKEYRNDVLTIYCMPRACEGLINTFNEHLGSVTMVSLGEETVFGKQAKAYLRNLSKTYGIKGNHSLYKSIEDEGKGYSSSDLNQIFDEWYDKQMKTRIYTQYADFQPANRLVATKEAEGSAFDELSQMIGLTEAKEMIKQALDFYKAQKLFKEKGFVGERPAMHMVFTGNPGTAKTTVARLFAQIMKDNNLLSIGDLYEVGRGDLVDKYVGWTAKMVKSKFKAAKGSVLFIDEAYSLVDDRDGSFGDEAINTIVQEMENNREDLIVIFAGYPDKMEEFLRKNPGLRSRIGFHIPFADYSTKELIQITELLASKRKLKLGSDVRDKLIPIYEDAKGTDDFGNGRFARNMIEKAVLRQGSRLLTMDIDAVTTADIESLTGDDFEVPEAKAKRARIGFIGSTSAA